MADNFDLSARGGGQRDGDSEILTLFRQWLDESRIADGIEDESPEWHEVMDRRYEIERRIASCHCGPAGLAVKTFILLRSECSDWTPSLVQIRCEDLFRAGDPGWNTALLASILRDAAVLVPEIGDSAYTITAYRMGKIIGVNGRSRRKPRNTHSIVTMANVVMTSPNRTAPMP